MGYGASASVAPVPDANALCAGAAPLTGGAGCRTLARNLLEARLASGAAKDSAPIVSAANRCLLNRGSAIDHRDHVCAGNPGSPDCQKAQAALIGELALATCEAAGAVSAK
jgi:hypothetical protein